MFAIIRAITRLAPHSRLYLNRTMQQPHHHSQSSDDAQTDGQLETFPAKWQITILSVLPLLFLVMPPAVAYGQKPETPPSERRDQQPPHLGTRKAGEDWPQFLGPTGDSKSPESNILKDWRNDALQVIWQVPLLQSYGAPTISRGRLFLFDSERVRRGQNVAKLLCLNSETGEKQWEYRYEYEYSDQYGYNDGPRCSPIVDGDRVYIYGVDGRLDCVNVSDGTEIWHVNTSAKYNVIQNFFGVGSNPVIHGNLLIAMVGGSPPATRRIDLAKGNGSGIVAFDKFTGKEVYRFSNQLASYASLKLTASEQRSRCLAFTRGGLLSFDPANGKQDFFFDWRAPILESVNASVPVVFDDRIFISETYGPGSALLDFSGKTIWKDERNTRDKAMQTHWNTAIYHKGFLYGSSGRHQYNAELRCINAATGKIMWSEPGLSRCSLLYVDDHLICLSETGQLLLLKATSQSYQLVTQCTFSEQGRNLLKPPAWAAPVLAHGLLYLRGDDRLICTELIPTR